MTIIQFTMTNMRIISSVVWWHRTHVIEFEREGLQHVRHGSAHATPSKLHGERKMSVTRALQAHCNAFGWQGKKRRRITNETKQLNIFTPKPVNKQACARWARSPSWASQCILLCGGCLPGRISRLCRLVCCHCVGCRHTWPCIAHHSHYNCIKNHS